jgi:peptidoglycan/LPS O-acetylase OafA/YrhL
MGVLRLALAISVLCTHLGAVHAHTHTIFGCTFLDGETAVEIFFMISGFYMALVLHEKYIGSKSYFIFITQRVLRLWPTYLVTTLLTVAVMGILMKVGSPESNRAGGFFPWRDHMHALGFISMLWIGVSNMTAVGLSELFYFAFDDKTGCLIPWSPWGHSPALEGDVFILNPPAWSVSLEIYFYFLAPKLVRCSIWVQLAIIMASVTLRYVIQHVLHWPQDPFVYRNFFCQLGFFMSGSLCYQFYVRYRKRIETWGKSWRHGLWVLGLLMLFYRRLPWTHQLYVVVIPLMLFLIPLLFALTRNNPVDRLLGELSYPFYLSHFLVVAVAYYFRDYFWMVWVGPCALLLTLTIAWLLYRYVESWSERFRARLYHRQCPKVALSPQYFPSETIEQLHVP